MLFDYIILYSKMMSKFVFLLRIMKKRSFLNINYFYIKKTQRFLSLGYTINLYIERFYIIFLYLRKDLVNDESVKLEFY